MNEQSGEFGFKDPTGLTRWAKWLLRVFIALSGVMLVSDVLEYHLLLDLKRGAFASEAEMMAAATASDTRQQIIGWTYLAFFAVAGFLILKWIYRANLNARALGAQDLNYSPGWAVGWYFVPFANLWIPYSAMKEIWKASADPAGWKAQTAPALLNWWWFLWIAGGVLGNLSLQWTLKAEELPEYIKASWAGIGADVLAIATSLVLLEIIGKIHGMQMSHHGKAA